MRSKEIERQIEFLRQELVYARRYEAGIRRAELFRTVVIGPGCWLLACATFCTILYIIWPTTYIFLYPHLMWV